jgi:hypothetical protein
MGWESKTHVRDNKWMLAEPGVTYAVLADLKGY